MNKDKWYSKLNTWAHEDSRLERMPLVYLRALSEHIANAQAAEMNQPQEVAGDNQYLCTRCGRAERDHPNHKCIGFAFESRKFLGGLYMTNKERAERMEGVIDRMSETIVELRRQLFFSSEETQKYRERLARGEK